ncbi:MAG: DMT family transporter, partial [Bacteroidetes bacterium]|nr:DMT family transporter [Bacteroidota bacterium]
LNEVSLPQFGFWWFLTAIFWNSLMALHPKGGFSIKKFTRKDYRTLIIMGFIELVATSTLYAAIAVSVNPAIPSFLRNLEYLFISVLGFVLLGERLGKWQLTGAFLTLSGAFIISLRTSPDESFFTAASGLMLISTTFYAARTIIAKKHIREISPVVLSINRALFLMTLALFFMVSQNLSFIIPTTAFINIMAGAFVGPFLTSIFQYSALKYIEASKAAIVQSTTGMFVMLGAFFLFAILPTTVQVIGGLIAITGVVIMMFKKK